MQFAIILFSLRSSRVLGRHLRLWRPGPVNPQGWLEL